MVKLAMYKGKGLIGNALIRWWTGSIYSHCELVIEGWCYSSSIMDKGVRRKEIEMDTDHWDLIDLHWADAQYVLDYFNKTDLYTYGYTSLISSQLFNRNLKEDDSEFCSEWCASALKLPSSATYAPHALGALCDYINKLHSALGEQQ